MRSFLLLATSAVVFALALLSIGSASSGLSSSSTIVDSEPRQLRRRQTKKKNKRNSKSERKQKKTKSKTKKSLKSKRKSLKSKKKSSSTSQSFPWMYKDTMCESDPAKLIGKGIVRPNYDSCLKACEEQEGCAHVSVVRYKHSKTRVSCQLYTASVKVVVPKEQSPWMDVKRDEGPIALAYKRNDGYCFLRAQDWRVGLGCSCLTPERCGKDEHCALPGDESESKGCKGCAGCWYDKDNKKYGTDHCKDGNCICGAKDLYWYNVQYTWDRKTSTRTGIKRGALWFNPPGPQRRFMEEFTPTNQRYYLPTSEEL